MPGNVGALSGPATVEIGRDQLWQFRLRLPLAIGLISCNGVSTASEVRRRIDMGADMTSGVTIFMQNEHAGISYGRTALILAQEYAYLSSDNS